jgi:hypothetical protein
VPARAELTRAPLRSLSAVFDRRGKCMDAARKRELKKAGKAEVALRSAELKAAMRDAYGADDAATRGGRGWSDGYRIAYRNEAWLRRGRPILTGSQIEKLFVVLPRYGAPRNEGPYVVCQCGSAAPVSIPRKLFYWASCECGNITWHCVLGWRRGVIRDWGLVFPATLIPRHRRV